MGLRKPASLQELIDSLNAQNPMPEADPNALIPGGPSGSLESVKAALDRLSMGVPGADPSLQEASGAASTQGYMTQGTRPSTEYIVHHLGGLDVMGTRRQQGGMNNGNFMVPVSYPSSQLPRSARPVPGVPSGNGKGQAILPRPRLVPTRPSGGGNQKPGLPVGGPPPGAPPVGVDARLKALGGKPPVPAAPPITREQLPPITGSYTPYDPDEEIKAIMAMRAANTAQAKSILENSQADPSNLWAALGGLGADVYNRGKTGYLDKILKQGLDAKALDQANKIKALDYAVKDTGFLGDIAKLRMQQRLLNDRMQQQAQLYQGRQGAQLQNQQDILNQKLKAQKEMQDKNIAAQNARDAAKAKLVKETSPAGKLPAKQAIALGQSAQGIKKMLEVRNILTGRQMGRLDGAINSVKSLIGNNDPQLAKDLATIKGVKFNVAQAAAGGFAPTDTLQKDVSANYPNPGNESYQTSLGKADGTIKKMIANYEGQVRGLEAAKDPNAVAHRAELEALKNQYNQLLQGNQNPPVRTPFGTGTVKIYHPKDGIVRIPNDPKIIQEAFSDGATLVGGQ